jgi:NTP pyrophosphatase (non-canonical NTP hydrolase)
MIIVKREVEVTIRELQNKAFGNALQHGFHHKEQSLGELLCLIHSELSEALEADRNGRRADLKRYQQILEKSPHSPKKQQAAFESLVKDTVEDELADAMIRIADLAGYLGIDLEAHVKAKMKYNKKRPRLHGKAY